MTIVLNISVKIVMGEKEQNKAFPWFAQGYKVAMVVVFGKQDCKQYLKYYYY